ncbi:hypothetical protein M514_17644, partial [Trichuris suis]
ELYSVSLILRYSHLCFTQFLYFVPTRVICYHLSLRVEVLFTESTELMKKKNFLQRFSELSRVVSCCHQRMEASTEESAGK